MSAMIALCDGNFLNIFSSLIFFRIWDAAWVMDLRPTCVDAKSRQVFLRSSAFAFLASTALDAFIFNVLLRASNSLASVCRTSFSEGPDSTVIISSLFNGNRRTSLPAVLDRARTTSRSCRILCSGVLTIASCEDRLLNFALDFFFGMRHLSNDEFESLSVNPRGRRLREPGSGATLAPCRSLYIKFSSRKKRAPRFILSLLFLSRHRSRSCSTASDQKPFWPAEENPSQSTCKKFCGNSRSTRTTPLRRRASHACRFPFTDSQNWQLSLSICFSKIRPRSRCEMTTSERFRRTARVSSSTCGVKCSRYVRD